MISGMKDGILNSDEIGEEHNLMNDDMNVKTDEIMYENKCADPTMDVKNEPTGKFDDECELVNKKTWCRKHNCLINKVTVTSKKWQWIRSKNCYGNVSSKVSKYLCKSKKSGRVEPIVPPTIESG